MKILRSHAPMTAPLGGILAESPVLCEALLGRVALMAAPRMCGTLKVGIRLRDEGPDRRKEQGEFRRSRLGGCRPCGV